MADDTPPVTGEPDPPAPTSQDNDIAAMKAALSKANKEAETLRRKAKELEDRDKSELDKLRDELASRDASLADLPRQARQEAIRFASECTRMGFLDPEDALLNMSDVDLSDNDAVKAALTALAERKPHLVRAKPPAPKVPARPTAGPGEHIGSPAGDTSAKERAAAALRSMRHN